jgi:hypothetical protein
MCKNVYSFVFFIECRNVASNRFNGTLPQSMPTGLKQLYVDIIVERKKQSEFFKTIINMSASLHTTH